MSRLARPADRLATGSRLLARRVGARAATWVARARRDDLAGWRAALGCWLRLGLLTFGLYALWRLVRAIPNVLWLLSAVWLAVSWRTGKRAGEAVPAESSAPAPSGLPAPDARAVLVHWLDRLTRGRSGIHLDELHEALTRHPDLAGLNRPEMRAWLGRHQITVDRTLRVGSVAGRSGVSRATIEALLATLPSLAESGPVDSSIHASDLHDSPVESRGERGGEPAGEGGRTTPTAVLVIGDFASQCGHCGVPAFVEDTHHTRAAGGSRKRPCGARFVAMRHADGRGKEDILRALRPDLPIA